MRHSIQSLNRLLKLLLESGFDFVIVGGFAGVLHGSSMVTSDLDLCLMLSAENVEKLRLVLKDFRPKLRITPQRLSFLEYPESVAGLKNLYLETDLGIVDFISEITGVGSLTRVLQNAVKIRLFDSDCKVISISDLIASKLALGRPKDLAMVKELRVIELKFK